MPSSDNLSIPPATDYEHKLLGWAKEAIEEGEAFLRAQRGYDKIKETINQIMGDQGTLKSDLLSSTSVNHLGKVASDLTAMCTDIKPFWEYRSKNERYEQHVTILGGLSEHWWLTRLIDMKNADTIRYSLAAGTGYSHIFYNSRTEDLDLSAEDPKDVLPIRPPSTSLSLQECFGVIHRAARTLNYVRALFPQHADKLVPDRDGSMVTSYITTRAARLLDQLGSPFRDRLFGSKPQKEIPRVPMVDLYTMYIDDRTKARADTQMGEFNAFKEPVNNWSYMAKKGDLLYPRKRCIIFTNTAVLYDGPNIYWHGMYPYAKLTLDPWPWSWLGKGVLWDLLPIQASLNKVMRMVDDQLEKIARPDVIADKNAISKAELDRIDTRRSGLKLRHNPLGGKGLVINQVTPLQPEVFKAVEYYEQKLYELSSIRDLTSLMRLNQLPSSETIERMLEAMAPAIRLRSRIIEAYMRDVATMVAWDFSQFYTLPLRLTILGEQGATQSDFDFDPDTFIPAFTVDSEFNEEGLVKAEALARGPAPRYNRAKEFFKQISYHIAPSSLLNASEIERQLKYLQLARAGLIDHWTLLDVLNIPNVGNPPQGANTITERLLAEMQMGLGMQVSAVGRKASGQELPQVKSSGAVSESG